MDPFLKKKKLKKDLCIRTQYCSSSSCLQLCPPPVFFFCFCMSRAITTCTEWPQHQLQQNKPCFETWTYTCVRKYIHIFIDGDIPTVLWVCSLCWHAACWCARNRLSESVSSVQRGGNSRGREHTHTHTQADTRQVCTAYVVTWCL